MPGRGVGKEDCLLRRVQAQFPDAVIVHRLDMGTSGIVVLARDIDAQRELSILFQERQVHKRYQALVDGCWKGGASGEIALPIHVDAVSPAKRKVDFDHGRESSTRYRVLRVCATQAITRVELEPLTGRTHQLRVHMAAMGHPILGDDFYGTPSSCAKAKRLMLHACGIEFVEPATGALLRFDCPPPF